MFLFNVSIRSSTKTNKQTKIPEKVQISLWPVSEWKKWAASPSCLRESFLHAEKYPDRFSYYLS